MSEYIKNTLIAKRAPNYLGGLWDDIKDLAKGTVDFYGQAKQNQGAADALKAQQTAQQMPITGGGTSTSTMLLLAGLGIGAILLLKKRKK